MSADIRAFGRLADGAEVWAVHLQGGGLSVTVLTLGALVQDVRLAGVDWPLTLGAPDLAAYEGPMNYFGVIVGPVANRIAAARAVIGGREFRFEGNDGAKGDVTLHGGPTGISAQVWQIMEADADRVLMGLDLLDGMGGFPGKRRVEAEFRLGDAGELTITLTGRTDAATLMNLTNHSYWNLDGAGGIAGQKLRVAADHYLPLNADRVPLGEVADVTGTVFDLREGRVLEAAETYDVNLCVSGEPRELTEVAELVGREGVRLRVATTEPGLQIYDMARVDTAPFKGHGGEPYGPFAGLAMEAQLWPDAVHHPNFAPITLGAGETREQITRLRFDRV